MYYMQNHAQSTIDGRVAILSFADIPEMMRHQHTAFCLGNISVPLVEYSSSIEIGRSSLYAVDTSTLFNSYASSDLCIVKTLSGLTQSGRVCNDQFFDGGDIFRDCSLNDDMSVYPEAWKLRAKLFTLQQDYIRYKLARLLLREPIGLIVMSDELRTLGMNSMISSRDQDPLLFANRLCLDPGSHTFPNKYFQRPLEFAKGYGIPFPLYSLERVSNPYRRLVGYDSDGREHDIVAGLIKRASIASRVEYFGQVAGLRKFSVTLGPDPEFTFALDEMI